MSNSKDLKLEARRILAQNLEHRMYERRVKKAELSRQSGISRSAIDAYLMGAMAANLDTLEALGQALDASVGWLLTNHEFFDLVKKEPLLDPVLDVSGLDEKEIRALSKTVLELKRRKAMSKTRIG